MNSISAPRWTEEDELRESRSLSASEREQVYADLFGYDRSCSPPPPCHHYPQHYLEQQQQQQQNHQNRCNDEKLPSRRSSSSSLSSSKRESGSLHSLSSTSGQTSPTQTGSTTPESVPYNYKNNNSECDETTAVASSSSCALGGAGPGGDLMHMEIMRSIETTALLRMVEVIEGMPRQINGAYMDAMRYNPKLVNLDVETNLQVFLRRENGVPEAAAERVCAYWTMRKNLFGDSNRLHSIKSRSRGCDISSRRTNNVGSSMDADADRFCRPVSLTGDGIMNEEDIRLLQTGVLQFLPNDSQGRTVLFFDKEAYKRPKEYSRACLCRCIFYMLHRAMTKDVVAAPDDVIPDEISDEDDKSEFPTTITPTMDSSNSSNTTAKQDIVLVCNFKNYDASHFDRKCFKTLMEMINICLPVRIVAQHYCYGSKKSAFHLVLPTMKSLMGPSLRQRLCVHTGTERMIAESLASFGILYVPPVLGGKYVPVPYTEWIEQSREKELHRHLYRTSHASDTGVSSKAPVNLPSKLKSTWNRAA